MKIAWAPAWSSPISTDETAMGSGLAVYAGSKYIPEAVTFLNMLASDPVIGNLLGEGIEGESYEVIDGTVRRIGDRAGWSVWRYGVVGVTSGATPLGSLNEWVDFKTFNASGVNLKTGVFSHTPVDTEISACEAVIARYSVPFGSGALDPAEYDAFIAELKAVGVDKVVAEAVSQYNAFKAS
jgi:putative aldouronate transport system substrate-binding protein